MEKKTLQERVSRLQGRATPLAQMPVRFLGVLCPVGVWLVAVCALAALLAGYAWLAPIALGDVSAAGAFPTEPASSAAPGSGSARHEVMEEYHG